MSFGLLLSALLTLVFVQADTLVLPGGELAAVSVHEQAVGAVHIFYEDDLLEGEEGRLWVRSLQPSLEKAHSLYSTFFKTGMLPQCQAPAPKLGGFTAYFVTTLKPNAGAMPFSDVNERRGYNHPANRGPIVQAVPWDDEAVRGMLIHEAFHLWCQSRGKTNEERWMEEGAADLLSYLVGGHLPQINITRYFKTPHSGSPYGGSFLWWLALLESRRLNVPHLLMLARYHLGLRQDQIYGSMFDQVSADGGLDFPYAELASAQAKAAAGSQEAAYWKQPWGMIQLEAPTPGARPTGSFVWHGPLDRN